MSVENLSLLSVISFVLAGALFVTAVLLFFLLRISKVISELSGLAQKNAVKKLKNKQNITTTKELPKVSGGLKAVSIDNKNMTDKLMAYDMSQSQTTVLQPVGETTVLGVGYGETTVIGVSANAAQPQAQDMQQDQTMQNTQIAFVVCEDITLCEGNAI